MMTRDVSRRSAGVRGFDGRSGERWSSSARMPDNEHAREARDEDAPQLEAASVRTRDAKD
jgi:hypothetical protein